MSVGERRHTPNVSPDSGAPSNGRFMRLRNVIRPLGTHHRNRRRYETTAPRETELATAGEPDHTADFADSWAAPRRERG